MDPTGHFAFTAGVSGIAAFIFGVKGEVGIAVDDDGHIGFYATPQVVTPGLGFGLGVSFGGYDVDTIKDLEGNAISFGGSLGPGGVEIESDGQRVTGVEVSIGGSGWIGSFYAAGGETFVWDPIESLTEWVSEEGEWVEQQCTQDPVNCNGALLWTD